MVSILDPFQSAYLFEGEALSKPYDLLHIALGQKCPNVRQNSETLHFGRFMIRACK